MLKNRYTIQTITIIPFIVIAILFFYNTSISEECFRLCSKYQNPHEYCSDNGNCDPYYGIWEYCAYQVSNSGMNDYKIGWATRPEVKLMNGVCGLYCCGDQYYSRCTMGEFLEETGNNDIACDDTLAGSYTDDCD